jgi:alkylation response protein AidB-like acyl-CoA dehydrogenase
MDFRLTEEQEKRRKEFFDVCKELEKKKPEGTYTLMDAFEIDTEEGIAYQESCRKEFAKRGWLRLGWPSEYGGTGTVTDRAFLGEATGYHGVPGVDGFGVGMLAPMLLSEASEEIKRRFLPPIGNGDVLWCELWSEPNAGSDLAAVSTTAVRKGDEYIINGQKTWTSFAHRTDWGFGLFKTDPQGRKHHNLSFLLVDMKTPGVTIKPLYYFDGKHFYNEVFFDDVHVPAENIVGEENKGWQVAQTLAGFERSSVGIIMTLQRQLEDLVEYCNETKVRGKPLSRDPIIRNRLAEVACEIEANRTLAYHVADLQDRNQMALFDASAIKVYSSELWERLAALAADILGVYGQVKTSKWAPMGGAWESNINTCLITSIAAGTNEIQKNIIAWFGLGMPRPPKPTPQA